MEQSVFIERVPIIISIVIPTVPIISECPRYWGLGGLVQLWAILKSQINDCSLDCLFSLLLTLVIPMFLQMFACICLRFLQVLLITVALVAQKARISVALAV